MRARKDERSSREREREVPVHAVRSTIYGREGEREVLDSSRAEKERRGEKSGWRRRRGVSGLKGGYRVERNLKGF